MSNRRKPKPTDATRHPSRQQRLARMARDDRRKRRRRALLTWGTAAVIIVALAAIVTVAVVRTQANRPGLEAVQNYDVAQGHVTTPVQYAQTPPVGGKHAPVWLNCGIYDEPVPDENAVHSLEHGAVWITYRPDLPADQVEQLRTIVPDTYAILSPYPDLPAPVVASAWGHQLTLSGPDEALLTEFIRTYRQGPQTPEPGAACVGGIDR